MTRVLLLSTTTGYQLRSFGDAAARRGVELVFATDRCRQLDDPWRDAAIPVRFHREDDSLAAILAAVQRAPVDGIIAVGDRPVVLAARVAAALGLPGHPPEAAAASRDKRRTRERIAAAGLPAPWVRTVPLDTAPEALADDLVFPCVVKPAALSASRGVIRADDPVAFATAFRRLVRLLRSREIRALRDPAHDIVQIEGFIEGHEYALEGVLERGRLQTLAVFDKPDPLDGPFFEETIYVTPPALDAGPRAALQEAVAAAARALGLRHGPVHAECRVNARGVFVLEVAARPIGGLCARSLRFERPGCGTVSLEELLLAHACGEPVDAWRRETAASGVMMIPVPKAGVFRGVRGLAEAGGVAGIDGIEITARPDQRLVPLPEGASYLGFIFAHAADAATVTARLREAHAHLTFEVDPAVPLAR